MIDCTDFIIEGAGNQRIDRLENSNLEVKVILEVKGCIRLISTSYCQPCYFLFFILVGLSTDYNVHDTYSNQVELFISRYNSLKIIISVKQVKFHLIITCTIVR